MSYLEIALRVAGISQPAREQRAPAASDPPTAQVSAENRTDSSQARQTAQCGFPHCAGCYEVAPGVRIHPPKCGPGWVH